MLDRPLEMCTLQKYQRLNTLKLRFQAPWGRGEAAHPGEQLQISSGGEIQVLEAMSLTSRSWLDSIPSGSFRGESIPSLFATSEAACITWMMVLPPSSRHIMAISCSFITSSFPAPGPPLSLRTCLLLYTIDKMDNIHQ